MKLSLILAERTIEENLALARKYGHLVQMIELRADHLYTHELTRIAEIRSAVTQELVLSIRMLADRGRWMGSAGEMASLYRRAADIGYDYIEMGEGFPAPRLTNRHTRIIRSAHLLQGDSPDLDTVFARISANGDEIPRMTVILNSSESVIRFLEWTARRMAQAPRECIITGTGKKALFTNILGNRIGTMVHDVYAPGKIPLSGMLDIEEAVYRYNVAAITRETRVTGIVTSASSYLPPQLMPRAGIPGFEGNEVSVPFILSSEEETEMLRKTCNISHFCLSRHHALRAQHSAVHML
mgnify:CR=1 FL=1